MSNTLINRMRLMRQAGAIERAHVKPHLMRYSNAQHTHDLLSLLIQCWMADHEGEPPRAALLIRAHVHDAGEIVTGDVPSPIKHLCGEALLKVDAQVEQWLGCDPYITKEEQRYLDTADRFELFLWCHEEVLRGNTEVVDWLDGFHELWERDPLPPSFQVLREAAGEFHMGHLTNKQLQEAGGLL